MYSLKTRDKILLALKALLRGLNKITDIQKQVIYMSAS